MSAMSVIHQNIELMMSSALSGAGMDVIIVSTTTVHQEIYWQKRLELTRGQISKDNAIILAVHEDWTGGAGNALGTLYAFTRAVEKAHRVFDIDLREKISNGASVAIYHTAGQGTRLAPLPGSESNNKSGVKLPGMLEIDGNIQPITILEAVIRQTSVYAASRTARISVFWGDQIFIPATPVGYSPVHHADILCCLAPMPSAIEWKERGLEKYGLVAVAANGDATQVEKITYDTANSLIEKRTLSVEKGVGVSLGSFSVSYELMTALLEEFNEELEAKEGKLDSDPHFWMPLTLDEDTYLSLMRQKGVGPSDSKNHYIRMAAFKARFRSGNPSARLVGAVDVGNNCYWWDFGHVQGYLANVIKINQQTDEAIIMRRFFGITANIIGADLGEAVEADNCSLVINSKINKGKIVNSVVIGVNTGCLDIRDSVLINVSCPSITVCDALLYNVAEPTSLSMESGSIRADAYVPFTHHYALISSIERDGKDDWEQVLSGNPLSYRELSEENKAVDIMQAEMFSTMEHDRIKRAIFDTIW